MRIIVAYFLADVRMLGRMPGYTVPTLVLPSLFLLMFGEQRSADATRAAMLATSFATFAVFGVVFFKFGVTTAIERAAPWARYVRTLPVPPGAVLAGRSLSAVVFALIAASAVFATARLTIDATLTTTQLIRVYAGLLGGAVPFSLFGIAIGYWTGVRSSVAVANLIYLVLSYGGGLWLPPHALPSGVRAIARFLPTYHWGNVVWPGALSLPWRGADWLALALWTAAFGALALHGYLRDEGARY